VILIKDKKQLSVLDAVILRYLYENDYDSMVQSIPIKDLPLEVSLGAIRVRLQHLQTKGWINEGLKSQNTKSYYMTTEGKKFYEKELLNE